MKTNKSFFKLIDKKLKRYCRNNHSMHISTKEIIFLSIIFYSVYNYQKKKIEKHSCKVKNQLSQSIVS